MITISELSIQYGGRYLFENIAFSFKAGDRIGLIGRNGAGKSTLLKIIANEISPDSGHISMPKEYKIGYLPQDLDVYSDKSVFEETASALTEIRELEIRREYIAEQLATRTDYESKEYMDFLYELSDIEERFIIIGGHSSDADVEQVLLGLGFERKDFSKLVSEFSGGWQMRIELAKILLSAPDCILLDEPTNHLDIDSIRWLEQFLKNYAGSIMLVSHDRTFLDFVTNRTIEITLGRVYDQNLSYSKFMEMRESQREQQMNAYKNQQRQIAQTERFIERFRYKATFSSRVQSRVKTIDKMERIELEDEDLSKIRFRFPEPSRSSRLMVEATDLSKSYDGTLSVLRHINFAVERGEKIAFVGKNGEGKSTLAKILAKLENYDGALKFGGNVEIAYFAQHQAQMLSSDMTVFDVIDKAATGEIRTKIRSLLGAFLFSGDDIYKKVKVLSGGEKARLALCKLLLTSANLIILDEPTNHLDMISKDVLKNALKDFTGSIIVVSHDRDFLTGLTTKTIEFKHHKIKEFLGDINYYLEKNKIEYLKDLESNKNYKVNIEEIELSENQKERIEQKQQQRENSRLKKKIATLEQEISDLEQKIEVLSMLFQNSEFMSNAENVKLKQQEFAEYHALLKEKMTEWEKNIMD